MDMDTTPQAQSPYRPRPGRIVRTLLTVCLSAAVITPAPEAAAQLVVSDPAALWTAVWENGLRAQRWVETVQHYAATLQHYKSTIEHYANQVAFWKEQLVKLQGLKLELFKLENQFQLISEDQGLAEACPGAVHNAIDITSVLQSLIPDMGGNIVKEQNRVCEGLLRLGNRKYNKTVEYYKFLTSSVNDLEALHSDRQTKVGESVANLTSLLTDTERYATNLEEARKKWESDMAQADLAISMLKAQQSLLARRAMNGRPSPLGTLVNTAALRAAFQN